MSHEKYITDKLSHRLPSLLPDFVKEEAPVFEQFLKAYFEFLESEILVLETQEDLDGIFFEDGDGSMLLEPSTVSPSPDKDNSKIILETTATNKNVNASPFKVGEYIFGETNSSVAKIKVINKNILYVDTVVGNGFSEKEIVEGRLGGQKGTVKSYKYNTIVANNKLLDFGDIDHTTEDFVKYFQKDFVPSLDLTGVPNKRIAIKHIRELYQKKGTEESIKFLMRILYGQDSTVRYPDDETLYLSKSDFRQQRRLVVKMDKDNLPQATDKITKYDSDGKTVLAESVVENVYVINSSQYLYSCEIKNNHYGEFSNLDAVTFLDRDDKTSYTAVIKGIVSGVNTNNSSVYIEHDDSGVILLEDGSGLTLETRSDGGMYDLNDQLVFTGAKADTDTGESTAVVDGLTYGPITHIYIEDDGLNYNAGDIVVFDDNLQKGGAEAVIGSVGDEIILENATLWGQFEVTADVGQTVFSGVDNNGNRIFFNDNLVRVFVDGVESTPITDFSFKNDRVTFGTPLSGGELVEIYTEFNRLTYEDGDLVNQETTVGNVRSVKILNGGHYNTTPNVYPGGYLYFDDISGYQVNETVTGTNSSATATIIRLEPGKGRIVVRRNSSDTGEFITGEEITGADSSIAKLNTLANVASGTGAKLYAYGESIGGVESINIQDQGHSFDEDAIIANTSYFPMLITTPTANLTRDLVITGDISGATAKVVSYEATKHILKITELDGWFLDNETVSFNNVDEFKILKFDPFIGRGTQSGEGIMQKQFLGTRSYLDEDASNIQDGYLYQTHSYVVSVGESINKWRSALKDLIHPSGHVFFGEVAIKNNINTVPENQFRFRPTIIIGLEVVPYVVNGFSNSMREIEIYTNADEMNDPLIVLKDAGGDQSSNSPNENAHFNVNIQQLHSLASSQVGLLTNNGIPTVLSLDTADNNYLVRSTERRPAIEGKIYTSQDLVDERLILEDGYLIELEEDAAILRMEPSPTANVKGDYGDTFISETGEQIRLEEGTTDEPVHYFTTERSIELKDKYFLFEDHDRIVFEDGEAMVDEDAGSHSYTSFVPFGPTLRTINIISNQQTYKISYYLKDEVDEDDILLEDGHGALLSEESHLEGVRFYDLENYLPKTYVAEYPLHERKRTNLTFNSYVKSA